MKKIERKLRNVLRHWGFGEIESAIFATLATSDGLTAQEISHSIGYAYSTTINSLNNLIRLGYVERMRGDKKFIYFANLDFVKIMERESKKISSLLRELFDEIHEIEDSYKDRLKKLKAKIEKAIKYLEGKKAPE